ncbi:MAG: O-antigen ligase family protein [Bacteroidota bacterium]
MQQTLFDLGQEPVKLSPVSVLKRKLYQDFIADRFDSPLGYFFILFIGFGLAYFVGTEGVEVALATLGMVLAIPALMGALFHLRFGVYMTLTTSVFILGVKRFVGDVPIGVFLDAAVIVMLFGLLIKQIKERDLSFLKHPLSIFVIAWIGYSLFEGFNPYPRSIIPWIYTVRHIALLMLIYFVGLYVFSKASYIRNLMRLWVGLSTLGALYGLKQVIWGFSAAEYEWIMADAGIFELYYLVDRFRIFSFFSDPTVFGIMMAASSLMCIPFLRDPNIGRWKRLGIGLLTILMLIAMIYSGTRTAYIIFPAGLFFMTAMKPTRDMIVMSASVLMLGLGLLIIPTENQQILRLRTAFSPESSDSYQTRIQNQAYIQPIIQEYPIGNGLGTTGIWGQRFAPERLLSQFPPDSGYVRLGVETGWIGLLLFCSFMAAILWVSIRTYFRSKNEIQQRYALAFFGFLFALILAHYPQQAITQLPNSIMFYLSMAVIIRIRDVKWPEAERTKVID